MYRHSLDFGWTEVPGIDPNNNPSGLIFTDFIDALSRPSMGAFKRTTSSIIRETQLTLFSYREFGRPSRQTHARSAFHQLREQSHQQCLAGACATFPLRSHELREIKSTLMPPTYMDILCGDNHRGPSRAAHRGCQGTGTPASQG